MSSQRPATTEIPAFLTIQGIEDVDRYLEIVRKSSVHIQEWFASNTNVLPFELMRRLKFEPFGRHPLDDRALNLIEQINQTFTFAAALEATRKLLQLHPNERFQLAPGAHASLDLDIMSETIGLVGAEVFAAVDPRNNRKLEKDRAKLAGRTEQHRYIFFMSPGFPGTQRLVELEKCEIQVWSVDFNAPLPH